MMALFFFDPVYALGPIENTLLGNLKNKNSDPLNYILSFDGHGAEGSSSEKSKKFIKMYQGFVDEARNLQNSCTQKDFSNEYEQAWERVQVKRSIMATMQYIALDLSSRAIVEYAKYFEFKDEEFENLSDGLVGNFCSENLSVISKRELKKYFKNKFDGSTSAITLPRLDIGNLFPPQVVTQSSDFEGKRREFYYTIEIFKRFCSWGNEEDEDRLLVPFMKNPLLYSFLARNLGALDFDWNRRGNKILLTPTTKGVFIHCNNLLCRKVDREFYNENIPRLPGEQSFYQTLNRLYCEDFRLRDYKYDRMPEKLKKIAKKTTFDEENLMISQLVSLIVGIADPIVRSEKYSDVQKSLRSNFDNFWNRWADTKMNALKKVLHYENPVRIKLVKRSFMFNSFNNNLKIMFDVDLGEFDQMNQVVGKLQTGFKVSISNKFLKWLEREWVNRLVEDSDKKRMIHKKLHAIMSNSVETYFSYVDLPIDQREFIKIISKEFLEQIDLLSVSFENLPDKGLYTLPVQLNYGIFALKHLYYKGRVKIQKNRRKRGKI